MRPKLAVLFLTAAWAGLVVLPGCRSDTPGAPAPGNESSAGPSPTTQVSRTNLNPTTTSSGGDIVARVNGLSIARQELDQPLVEAYGLTVLLNLVQVDLARQQILRLGLHVSPEDIHQERDITLAKLFANAAKSDYEQLLDQFLHQQHSSRAEFDLTVEANAYLRKFAATQLPGKITDDMMHSAFSQLYGENRQVRDIELANMLDVGQAQRRVANGEPFEKVAREMSLDRRTAALGGELPPFSAQSPNIPDAIKQNALTLKVGQVSPDAIVVGATYHLIKLTNIIPPKIAKYEDVKDSVRRTLEEQWLEFAMREYRNQLGQLAIQTLQIDEPVLREQWRHQLEQKRSAIRDRDSALAEINRQRQNAATQSATTTSSTNPATTPTTAPASSQPPPTEQPPATTPGASSAPGTPPVSAPAPQP